MLDPIIDGRKIARFYEERLKEKIAELERAPTLHTILVGEDEGSKVYVGVKDRGCKRVGIETRTHKLKEDVDAEEVAKLIEDLNHDDEVDGVLLQMPFPKHIDTSELVSSIDISKDVEGMHPFNLGKLITGSEGVVPCTPGGIITMLEYEDVKLQGRKTCVVSHSPVVGKPIALMLLNRNATVTVVHEYTDDLGEHTSKADLLIAAAGVPGLITSDMVKSNAVVVDVGMNRLENGRLVGDVEFDDVKKRCEKITPVPGGVGPMTVLTLLQNTVKLVDKQSEKI